MFLPRISLFCSILFADLVNFTDLTTKCSAKDLVAMLNEIYGRFDGIARVGNSQTIDSFAILLQSEEHECISSTLLSPLT